jgi:hypothetical protein
MKTPVTIISLSAILTGIGISAHEPPQAIAPGTTCQAYDPLTLPVDKPPAPLEFTVTDTDRHRDMQGSAYTLIDTVTIDGGSGGLVRVIPTLHGNPVTAALREYVGIAAIV